MATATGLMTVEEFRRLPETGPFYYELRHGGLVQVTRPKFRHYWIQETLRDLLKEAAGKRGHVGTEFAFRALPQHELRVADVAYLSAERWLAGDDEDNIWGAPEIVIEVLSPSNTATEIQDKQKLCLENGCCEFWVVNPELRQIQVYFPDGTARTYPSGARVPLTLFGDQKIAVDDVFKRS